MLKEGTCVFFNCNMFYDYILSLLLYFPFDFPYSGPELLSLKGRRKGEMLREKWQKWKHSLIPSWQTTRSFVKCFIFWMHWQTNKPEEELGGKDKSTLELANAISWEWLYLHFHLPFTDGAYCGFFVIQPAILDPALINTSNETSIEAFPMTNFTISFYSHPSFTRCWPNKDTNTPSIQVVIC